MAELEQVLHEAWLAIHSRRLEDRSATVDSFYAGITAAEHELSEVAAKHGINWHAIRQPLTTPPEGGTS